MDSPNSHFARDYPARFYEDFYRNQAGGSRILPHYRPQRGRGIFGKIFRGFVLPTLGKAVNTLKREAPKRLLSLGQEVLGDVVEGRSLKGSLKRRGLNQLKRAAGDILEGSPRKRRKGKKKQVGGARRKRRARTTRKRQSVRYSGIKRATHVSRRRRKRRAKKTNRQVTPFFSRGRDIFA